MTMHQSLAPSILSLLLVTLAAFGTGCSVLGVATKGDLEDQETRWEARDQAHAEQAEALAKELAEIARGLEAFERDLEVRLSAMQEELGEIQEVRVELGTLGKKLEVAKQEMTILEGQMSRDLDRVEEGVSTATAQAEDAQSFAHLAEARGQQVMDSVLTSLRNERDLLRRENGKPSR
jgi:chromosome segregation ATPase